MTEEGLLMTSEAGDRLISAHDVNCGRQNELDLARAVITFFLAPVHCMIECTGDEGLLGGIPYLFDTIIGGPFGAPMFMFLMGAGMVYTRHREPKMHLLRGMKILLMGYALNVCRFFIPYLTGYALTGEKEKYIEPLLYKMLGNDIFVFAGIAMMVISVFIKMKLTGSQMILIAAVCSLAGTYLSGTDVKAPIGNIFLGYLIGTEDAAGMVISDFPLLNWLLFPVCGYVYGTILKRVAHKKKFYLLMSFPAMAAALVYGGIGISKGFGMFGEGQNCYYHITSPDAAASLLLALGMLGVYYLICERLPEKMMKIIKEISSNTTPVYCIHWVMISFVVNVLIYQIRGTQELATWESVLLGSAISVTSIMLAHYYKAWKAGHKKYEKIS